MDWLDYQIDKEKETMEIVAFVKIYRGLMLPGKIFYQMCGGYKLAGGIKRQSFSFLYPSLR